MEHIVANNRSAVAGPPRPQGVNALEGNALTRPYYTSFVTVIPPALLASTIHTRMARAGRVENDSTEFATQVGRVLTELERDESFRFLAYKSVVAIARGESPRIADELGVIRNTGRMDLAKAMAPIYRPDNAVLVVAGDLDIDSTRAMVHQSEQRLGWGPPAHGDDSFQPSAPLRMNQSAVIPDQNKTGHYVVAIGWAKPSLGHRDQLSLAVANQLLLGRDTSVADPSRSDSSAIALRLARSLGGASFWDGRAGSWGAPDLVDVGPGIEAIVFTTDRKITVDEVRDSVNAALKDIRNSAMTDADIRAARESLASFHERWFFEPYYRIISDYLMAYGVAGRDPRDVKKLPDEIRNVAPSQVRSAFDRYLLHAPSDIVILPPR
jgi:predicted Zn-dependent peptidase